jgi:hypothetical protein
MTASDSFQFHGSTSSRESFSLRPNLRKECVGSRAYAIAYSSSIVSTNPAGSLQNSRIRR